MTHGPLRREPLFPRGSCLLILLGLSVSLLALLVALALVAPSWP